MFYYNSSSNKQTTAGMVGTASVMATVMATTLGSVRLRGTAIITTTFSINIILTKQDMDTLEPFSELRVL